MDFQSHALKCSDGSSTSSNLVLYSFWRSSCSWRVRFALNLKDGPVYLEEKYPQKALLPTDLRLKSLHLQVASIVSSSIQPLIMLELLKTIGEKFGPEEPLPWAQSTLEKGFNALEKLLKDFSGQYALGDEVHMADVFLAPQISSAIENFGIDMSKFPTLARIYESYKTLPEFQASSPERQLDALH
ncbi:hypothetical protein IC575_012907 [Cucumis melo]